ncbi:MAG: ATP-binding protein, partial [Longimicrobiales bacterium]
LRAALEERVAVARNRAAAAAEAAAQPARSLRGAALFGALERVRLRADVTAIAVFDASGDLVAWSGEHRGAIPPEVSAGAQRLSYVDRPLFGYLYVSHPVPESGGHATAVVLMQTGQPVDGAPAGLAEEFRRDTGAGVRFAERAVGPPTWVLRPGTDTVLAGYVEPATQAAARERLAGRARQLVLGLAAGAFSALVIAWLQLMPSTRGAYAAPLLASALFLLVAPLSRVLPLQPLFSPGWFLLDAPGEITLGVLLAVLLPVMALVASWRPPTIRRAFMLAVVVGAGIAAAAYAALTGLLLAASAPPLLENGTYLWGTLQLATVLALTLLGALLLPQPVPQGHPRRGLALLTAGAALAALLGALLIARWRTSGAAPLQSPGLWWAAFWAAPFTLLGLGLRHRTQQPGRLFRTLCAGWLAVTFTLPMLWTAHTAARVSAAERSLATLGVQPTAEPYIAYLLRRFAEEANARARLGEAGIHLMYRSWLASGLAEAGYPAQILLWDSDREPVLELHLAGARDPVPVPAALRMSLNALMDWAAQAGEPVVDAAPEPPEASVAAAIPLPFGFAMTAVVPPRRTLELTPALESFLGSPPRLDADLEIVPALGSAAPQEGDSVLWYRTERGWRSEALVSFPNESAHAHLSIPVSAPGVLSARAALLAAADLAVLTLLWLVGRTAAGSWVRPATGWWGWLRSFRARVTLALFAFFLLPTIVFGTLAYRAVAGEAVRAAELLATSAADAATAAYGASPGDLNAIAERIGHEVLYYFAGDLVQASSPEAVHLGLYGAWMPPDIYLALESGEQFAASQLRRIGDARYVLAFHSLAPAGTLAVPVSLAVGDAVTRQRELMHLILFAALLGGLLSLWLSVYVARALARPIGSLRRAAAAVGRGQLDLRLPTRRADEFGDLFESFNEMVRRLRRARSRELRTARVLAWGEMARQVAHEIKNPLTPIKLSVQHLRRAWIDRRSDFGGILQTNVEQMLSEIDRLSDIARAFSRYGAPAEASGPLVPVDVASVIRETLALYRAAEPDITYDVRVEEDLPRAQARSGELKEVLINLLENARAAVGPGGVVDVVTERMRDGITLCVSDDGEGIPAELLPRVFDPHFSTRTAGAGLGLAIVRRLVESWGGAVAVESEPTKGTTVRIQLEIADGGGAAVPGGR